jgi:hypothetical protein
MSDEVLPLADDDLIPPDMGMKDFTPEEMADAFFGGNIAICGVCGVDAPPSSNEPAKKKVKAEKKNKGY